MKGRSSWYDPAADDEQQAYTPPSPSRARPQPTSGGAAAVAGPHGRGKPFAGLQTQTLDMMTLHGGSPVPAAATAWPGPGPGRVPSPARPASGRPEPVQVPSGPVLGGALQQVVPVPGSPGGMAMLRRSPSQNGGTPLATWAQNTTTTTATDQNGAQAWIRGLSPLPPSPRPPSALQGGVVCKGPIWGGGKGRV